MTRFLHKDELAAIKHRSILSIGERHHTRVVRTPANDREG